MGSMSFRPQLSNLWPLRFRLSCDQTGHGAKAAEEFGSHETRALAVVRGRAPGLVLLLFVAGAPEESALVIAALLVCPLMMLMLLGTSRSSSANKPQTAYQATPSRFSPAG